MKKISAVVITYNEERHIVACLESLTAAVDEMVVVDSYSTDKTVERCRRFTDTISQRKFSGFGEQKQAAVANASHDWILQIDADERLSPALATELNAWKHSEDDGCAGYDLPFHFFFMNKRMRFGGCSPEYHARLFKKNAASYQGKTIHEGIVIAGKIGRFRFPVFHYSYDSITEYLDKCNRYTSLIAREKYQQGRQYRWWHMFRLPVEFITRYFLKLGILDGFPGLIYAVLSSYYALLKHLKLRDIEQQEKISNQQKMSGGR